MNVQSCRALTVLPLTAVTVLVSELAPIGKLKSGGKVLFAV